MAHNQLGGAGSTLASRCLLDTHSVGLHVVPLNAVYRATLPWDSCVQETGSKAVILSAGLPLDVPEYTFACENAHVLSVTQIGCCHGGELRLGSLLGHPV